MGGRMSTYQIKVKYFVHNETVGMWEWEYVRVFTPGPWSQSRAHLTPKSSSSDKCEHKRTVSCPLEKVVAARFVYITGCVQATLHGHTGTVSKENRRPPCIISHFYCLNPKQSWLPTVNVEVGIWRDGLRRRLQRKRVKKNEVHSAAVFRTSAWTLWTAANVNKFFFLFFLSIGGFKKRLGTYHRLLCWIVDICKRARAWNEVTKEKADQRGGDGMGEYSRSGTIRNNRA